MSSTIEHKDKSKKHQRAADAIAADSENESLIEWVVVIRFYVALQLLDAYLAIKGIHPESHGERSRELNQNPELSRGRGSILKQAYKRLRSISEQIRYDATYPFNESDIVQSDKDLGIVRSFLSSKIG